MSAIMSGGIAIVSNWKALMVGVFFTIPCWVFSVILTFWMWTGSISPVIAYQPNVVFDEPIITFPGGTVSIPRRICATRDVTGQGVRSMEGHAMYYLAPFTATFRAGCRDGMILFDVPQTIPPGLYVYRFDAIIQTNPISSVRVRFPSVTIRVLQVS